MRPRTASLRSELDGVATILVCHIVERVAQESRPSTPPLVEQHSESSLCYSMSAESESDTSDIPPLNVPLEAHLLPGHGRRQQSAVLPFICLANGQNIVDLMTSVACQRYVWGITQPAVGFALSDQGIEAKLVVSWVDPSTVSVPRYLTCLLNRSLEHRSYRPYRLG